MSEKVVAIPSSAVKSEDILGQKWDKFLSDSVIKTGGGFLLGKELSNISKNNYAYHMHSIC